YILQSEPLDNHHTFCASHPFPLISIYFAHVFTYLRIFLNNGRITIFIFPVSYPTGNKNAEYNILRKGYKPMRVKSNFFLYFYTLFNNSLVYGEDLRVCFCKLDPLSFIELNSLPTNQMPLRLATVFVHFFKLCIIHLENWLPNAYHQSWRIMRCMVSFGRKLKPNGLIFAQFLFRHLFYVEYFFQCTSVFHGYYLNPGFFFLICLRKYGV
ncbi:hypothetical protein L9F63_011833, partial [Diploptera punctata]